MIPIPAAQEFPVSDLRQVSADLRQQRSFRIAQIAELEATAAADPSDDIARSEITATLLRGARLALKEIDDALARVASGRYGVCTTCQLPITSERLEILPMAALCTPCQRHRDTGPDSGHRPVR